MECSTGKAVTYLDNNATTLMPPQVVKRMVEWTNKGNPSADYKSAKDCRKLMENFRAAISSKCGLNNQYHIIFTSCASESNNMFLRSVIEAHRMNSKFTPHIIISSIEHKSLLNCAVQLAKRGYTELSLIRPDRFGFIHAEDVKNSIRPNTILISIMQANNETGAINDISAIAKIAKGKKIIFHTDCVQSFSKFLLNPTQLGIDAFSISFHKMHGPAGVGAVIISNKIMKLHHLEAEICGTQNEGMRGGTENIPGLAAAFEGFLLSAENRPEKNSKMLLLKQHIMQGLSKYIECKTYREYLSSPPTNNTIIVFLSTCEKKYLPGTLLLSVVNNKIDVCNGKIKNALEQCGVIVSIGSACNTANSKASHVISEMQVSDRIKKGTLRISLGDYTDVCDADTFVKEFIYVLKNLNYTD